MEETVITPNRRQREKTIEAHLEFMIFISTISIRRSNTHSTTAYPIIPICSAARPIWRKAIDLVLQRITAKVDILPYMEVADSSNLSVKTKVFKNL
jgi:hypothetical protein